MKFFGLNPIEEDKRFYFEPLTTNIPLLKPVGNTQLGSLYFDPRLECDQNCYTGFQLTSKCKFHSFKN